MQLVAFVPLLVALVGILLWFLSDHPKRSEAGRLAFFAGLLAFCFAFAGAAVHLGAAAPGSGIH